MKPDGGPEWKWCRGGGRLEFWIGESVVVRSQKVQAMMLQLLVNCLWRSWSRTAPSTWRVSDAWVPELTS